MTAMSFYRHPFGNDQKVNAALDEIEAELRPALIVAIERVNAVLADNPTDTETLHHHASYLHRLVEDIDANTTRRGRITNRSAA